MNIDDNFFGNVDLEEETINTSQLKSKDKIIPTSSQIILDESAETPEEESIFNKKEEDIYVMKKKETNLEPDINFEGNENNVNSENLIITDLSLNQDNEYTKVSKTIIAEDCQIIGEIKSKSNLEIYGEIKNGDVKAAGNIVLGSKGFSEKGLFSKSDVFIELRKQDNTKYINGPVVGENINIAGGFIKGIVDAKQHLNLKENCVIVGEVKCKSAIINGAIQGDVTALGNVDLGPTAIIKGSVTAATINISEGATLDGTFTLTTKKDIDYDKIFK